MSAFVKGCLAILTGALKRAQHLHATLVRRCYRRTNSTGARAVTGVRWETRSSSPDTIPSIKPGLPAEARELNLAARPRPANAAKALGLSWRGFHVDRIESDKLDDALKGPVGR